MTSVESIPDFFLWANPPATAVVAFKFRYNGAKRSLYRGHDNGNDNKRWRHFERSNADAAPRA